MRMGIQNYVSVILLAQCEYFGIAYISAQLLWHGMNNLSRFLLLEAFPHNFWVPSIVCLLPSCQGKGNMSLGAFDHLGIVAIISVSLVL